MKKIYKQGDLTPGEFTTLVRAFQDREGLSVDGVLGPLTYRRLDEASAHSEKELTRDEFIAQLKRCKPHIRHPMPVLKLSADRNLDADALKLYPRVSSGFRHKNRPSHHGIDIFYQYNSAFGKVPVGDGGAAASKGEVKWWVPPGVKVRKAYAGYYLGCEWIAEPSPLRKTKTGHSLWFCIPLVIDARPYYLFMYLTHLTEDGSVGDNPSAYDARHLHLGMWVNKDPTSNVWPFLPRESFDGWVDPEQVVVFQTPDVHTITIGNVEHDEKAKTQEEQG